MSWRSGERLIVLLMIFPPACEPTIMSLTLEMLPERIYPGSRSYLTNYSQQVSYITLNTYTFGRGSQFLCLALQNQLSQIYQRKAVRNIDRFVYHGLNFDVSHTHSAETMLHLGLNRRNEAGPASVVKQSEETSIHQRILNNYHLD